MNSIAATYALVAMILPSLVGIAVVAGTRTAAGLWSVQFFLRTAEAPRTAGSIIDAVLRLLFWVGGLTIVGWALAQQLKPTLERQGDDLFGTVVGAGPLAAYLLVIASGARWYFCHCRRSVGDEWPKWLEGRGRSMLDILSQAEWRRTMGYRHLAYFAVSVLFGMTMLLGNIRQFATRPFASQVNEIVVWVVMAQLAAACGLWMLYLWGNPQLDLVRICLKEGRMRTSWGPSRSTLRPGRWRSTSHRTGFMAARCLIRCTRAATRKLAVDQAESVYATYCKLAESLRRAGLIADESDEARKEFAELLRAATTVVTAVDVASAACEIDDMIAEHPELPEGHVGRWRRIADATSDGMQRYWPAIQILATIVIIIALLTLGDYERLIELATQ
jgi:hypothetical protein